MTDETKSASSQSNFPRQSVYSSGGQALDSFGGGGTEELKGRTIRGGAVTVLSQFLRFGITTLSTVVLARLLTPQDYGLVAMVTAVIGFMRVFTDAGLSTATVQRSAITRELISTVFWINTGLGGGMTLLALASAPLMVWLYGDPRILWITFALATTFLLDALVAQHQALLRRRMRFVALAVVDVLSLAAGLTVGISMAIKGFGYWALVWMQISSAVATALVIWMVEPWVPGLPSRGSGARSMVRFGAFLTGSNLLTYLFRNVDNILIGWRWGASPLGLYQKAYSLLMLPLNQVNAPISNVAISALSRVQNDGPSQRRYFIRGYTIATSITMPIVLASTIFSEDIIGFLLGEQWQPSVAIFRLLAPAALAGALLNPFGWLFVSTGRADRQMRAGVVWTASILIAFVLGLQFGPQGVAVGYSLMAVLLAIPICAYAIKGTAVTMGNVVEALRMPSIALLIAGMVGVLLKLKMPASVPVGIRAVGGCTMVLTVYSIVLLVVMRQWRHYRDIVSYLLPGKRPALA